MLIKGSWRQKPNSYKLTQVKLMQYHLNIVDVNTVNSLIATISRKQQL